MPGRRSTKKRPDRLRRGEENPEILCGCGCGAKFPRFDEHGRPRRFLPGHARADVTVPDEVLARLQHGQERPAEIAEHLGRTVNAVSIALTKLRTTGRAEAFERGRWRPVEKASAA